MSKTDMGTLEDLSESLGMAISANVVAVKIDDPVASVEDSLTSLVKNSINCIEERNQTERAIDSSIVARLAEFNPGQLIEAKRAYAEDRSQAEGRIISPVVAAVVEKRYGASGEGGFEGNASGEGIYKKASKDVLQGLTALSQLLAVVNNKVVGDPTTTPPETL